MFTTIRVENKAYILLLEEVLNHDYEKSRFLKPAVLRNYLEVNGQSFTQQLINEEQFKAHEGQNPTPIQNRSRDHAVKLSRVEFFNQKFIVFNEDQLNAVSKTNLPLVISGAAGSGKSCVTLALLSQHLEHSDDEDNDPFLYITESAKLVNSMAHAWSNLPMAQGVHQHKVQFKSYEQLIQELIPETQQLNVVDKNHFITWFNEYTTTYLKITQKIKKNTLINHDFLTEVDSIYQEFRIISNCNAIEDYLKLGKKQSLFHEEHHKEWIYNAYIRYLKRLEDTQCIHLPFYKVNRAGLFKLIVVDEAQDFSHLQLKSLATLAIAGQVCFCEDNRQSLSDNKSKTPFLIEHMHTISKKVNHITLPFSYRCPSNVIQMANAISNIKTRLTQNGQAQTDVPPSQSFKGTVLWFTELSEHQKAEFQQRAQSPDFCVVTLEEHKEEAKKQFKTPLVFTPEEIKGLEYKAVMAYRFLDAPIYNEANRELEQSSPKIQKNNANRAKNNQGKEHFGPPFNAIYTMFTRTTETLYIYQEKKHALRHIIKTLEPLLTEEPLTPTPSAPSTDTTNEWFIEAKKQLEQGNEQQAREIFNLKLNKSNSEFELFSNLLKENYTTQSSLILKQKPIAQLQPILIKTELPSQAATPSENNRLNPNHSGENDQENYINKLLKNINQKNLNALFMHKKAEYYLFDIPRQNKPCLFTTLFDTHQSREILFKILPAHIKKLASKITKEAFCLPKSDSQASPLYWFSASPIGQNMLELLLNNNIKLAQEINAEDLGRAFVLPNDSDNNASPLYWLSGDSKGRAILKQLFDNNPNLIKELRASDLLRSITSVKNQHVNTSPLFWLAALPYGVMLLKQLLNNNPKLLQGINAADLRKTITTTNYIYANTSVLFWLTCYPEGKEILKLLLDNDTKLALEITGTDLGSWLGAPANLNCNASPLLFLSITPEGLSLLNYLLEKNPKLAQQIRAADLGRALTSKRNPDYNTSALYWLSGSLEGIRLLKQLIDKNPQLAHELTAAELVREVSFPYGRIDANSSPLYWLTGRPEGRVLIKQLIECNPKLAQEIRGADLGRALTTETNPEVNTSPLYWLSCCHDGVLLLNLLLMNNPQLINEINPADLERKVITTTSNKSPVDWLICSHIGLLFLDKLAKNPRLAKIINNSKSQYSSLKSNGFFSNIAGKSDEHSPISNDLGAYVPP